MSKIIIANWKMKLNIADSIKLAQNFVNGLKNSNKDLVICPSEISLSQVKNVIKDSNIKLGAQNVFWEELGSYTGEVSASTLEEAGCEYVIIGHSERRLYLLENYQMIHQKLKAVLDHSKIIPVICVGESIKDREADRHDYVVTDQLQQSLGGIKLMNNQQIIIAYEPIWAIGTGQAITANDAETMHEIIYATLVQLFGVDITKKQIKIVYGGSVTSKNVKQFSGVANIDGFLVGGASLEVNEFSQIISNV